MGLINWDAFGRTLAVHDNLLLAFLLHADSTSARVSAFSGLSEEEFFNPLGQEVPEGLIIEGADGCDLSLRGDSSSPFVINVENSRTEGKGFTWISQSLRIRIPSSPAIGTSAVGESGVGVSCSNRGTDWLQDRLEYEPGSGLWSYGHLVISAAKSPYRYEPKLVTLKVSVPSGDCLLGIVSPSSTCQAAMIGYRSSGVLAFAKKAQGGLGKPVFCGANQYDYAGLIDDGREPRRQLLIESLQHVVVAWSKRTDATCVAGNSSVVSMPGRVAIWRIEIPAVSATSIEMGGETFELMPPVPTSSVLSPVIAAISRTSVSDEGITEHTVLSLRGRLEGLLGRLLQEPLELRSLGHIALPADIRWAVDDVVSQGNGALLMNSEGAKDWHSLANFFVPEAIVTSTEAQTFREILAEVVDSIPVDMHGNKLASESGLLSQLSWRHLANESDLLERYLASYSSLMMRARELNDPAAVFWASYPLSASVWRLDGEGHCVALLLSPLHPLRLAWLATAEGTLWDADQASASGLAGAIEGWNLPLVGPRDTTNGRVVAIPIDNGQGQVFLGWSMLVEASIDGEKPLRSPDMVGDCAAPGTASSGLNAASVKAALQTYRRINPHVSTVTIDLAAASPTGRLTEVDLAVISAIRNQSADGLGTLGGGVRVRDSLNRQGEVPRTELAELIGDERSTPVMWSVYKHSNAQTQQCNVRLLQDAGIRLQVGSDALTNGGILGVVPLRRFEVPNAGKSVAGVSVSAPAVGLGSGWEPFSEALRILEAADTRPQLRSSLFQTLIADPRADWTVSGESLMSPSAMASLLAQTSSCEQMLWEWRPPFFASSGGAALLESRPFVTVVRVPGGFRAEVRKLIRKVTGQPVEEPAIDGLLGDLGARGVGLSSLIAIGGSHAAGAIGFYLTMGIVEKVVDANADQLILPIDACDTFLKALAGINKHGEVQKRADLLAIEIFDDELVLVPIEIKSYGLGAEAPNALLPAAGDYRLSEPVDQLESTVKVLRQLEKRQQDLLDESELAARFLWTNGLSALVEAGLRLKKDRSEDPARLARRFASIASGTMPVRVGRPIIAFFGHGAMGSDGASEILLVDQQATEHAALGDYGVLASNTGASFIQLQAGEGSILGAWGSLMHWAVGRADGRPVKFRGTGAPAPEAGPSVENLSQVGRAETPAKSFDIPSSKVGERGEALVLDANDLVGSEPAQSFELAEPQAAKDAGGEDFPPITTPGVKFNVGRLLNTVGAATAHYWPSNTDLNQMNIGVVGDLGTGKTQLLKMLMYQLRVNAVEMQHSPISMLVFDYKRDFQDPAFLDAVGGHVLRPRGIPMNVFALPGEYSKFAAYQRANAFLDILSKIYSGIGPVQRERLTTVILGLFESKEGVPPTMEEVLQEYRQESGKADAVTGVLSTFVLGEVFDDAPNHMVSFEEMIGDKVLVLALSDLKTDTNAKNALVVLFLNQYYEYMSGLRKWPIEGQSPSLRRLNSYLLVDEAFNIMKYEFPVLMDLMLQGREYGVGTILASQYLSHFKNGESNYGEPLLTWFIHKVPHVTTKELTSLGIPFAGESNATAISSLGVHHAYYSSLDFPGRFIRGIPFYELREGLVADG